MSTPDRTTIVKGAGAVKIDSVQLYSKMGTEINAVLDPVAFGVGVAGYGTLDQRFQDSVGKITFTPSGRLSADILAALYPYANPTIDSSIFGAVDTTGTVHSILGQKFVFANVAVTGMPSLKLSARNTSFSGGCELTALPANATARSASNSIYTGPTSEAFSPSLTTASIVTVPYSASWDTTSIETRDGWDIEFGVELEPLVLDDHGTIDMFLKGVTVMCKCNPVNLSESMWTLLRSQGTGATIGASMRQSKNLTITSAAGGITFVAYDAVCMQGPMRWGEGQLRAGQLGFVATRQVTGGTPAALFSIAMT